MKKLKVLVLGANGFIGSKLTDTLIATDYSVRAFDLFRGGESLNIKSPKESFELFSGDFLNQSDVAKALDDIDYVFHFISLTTPASSKDNPLFDIDTNLRGTIQLLEQCVKSKVKKIIFASSGGAIYGNQDKEVLSEDDATNPISPYAISKLTIEKYLEYFRKNYGLDYVALRYSNPYGPGQRSIGAQGIIPIFLHLIGKGRPVIVFGDGEMVRDYIYIDDLISATMKIFPLQTNQKIFNVGGGRGSSINDLISIMQKVTGKNVVINSVDQREIDVQKVVLDTHKINKEIGSVVNVSLDDGIEKTWQWMMRNEINRKGD